MKKIGNRKNKGFTLIEVIVAVTIVILLSALAVPKVSAYIDKAKEAKATTMAKQIYTAAMWSYEDQGNKFLADEVATAVSNTTNITLASSAITPTNSNLTVNFSTGNKNYKLSIDGTTDNYTVEDVTTSTSKVVFSSTQ